MGLFQRKIGLYFCLCNPLGVMACQELSFQLLQSQSSGQQPSWPRESGDQGVSPLWSVYACCPQKGSWRVESVGHAGWLQKGSRENVLMFSVHTYSFGSAAEECLVCVHTLALSWEWETLTLTCSSQGVGKCYNTLCPLAPVRTATTHPHPPQPGSRRVLHLSLQAISECNNDICQYLHPVGASHLSPAPPADDSRLTNKYPFQMFQMLSNCFFFSLGVRVSSPRGESKFPIALWDTKIFQPCWFSKPDILGAHLWCRSQCVVSAACSTGCSLLMRSLPIMCHCARSEIFMRQCLCLSYKPSMWSLYPLLQRAVLVFRSFSERNICM